MNTTTRRQRDLQLREETLLALARTMLIEDGYAGLSLDRLAKQAEYSKWAVYEHFSTKEDLIAALSGQSSSVRVELMSRAMKFPGRTRERALALIVADEVFGRFHPHYFHSELVIRMASLKDRVTPERLGIMEQSERWCIGLLLDLIREAVSGGDLALVKGRTVESIAFGLFSLAIGAYVSFLNFPSVQGEMKITDVPTTLRSSFEIMLDGLNWQPLSAHWDYEAALQRIRTEVFGDEFRRIGST